MDKVTAGTVSTNHNLFEEKGEPKRYRTEVVPVTSLTPYTLGQTGSQHAPSAWFPFNCFIGGQCRPVQRDWHRRAMHERGSDLN